MRATYSFSNAAIALRWGMPRHSLLCLRRSLAVASLPAALLAAIFPLALHAQSPEPADVILRGGTIYDGSEGKPYVGDIALNGDRIVYVGRSAKLKAARVIDVKGMIVAPGLIDAHTHPDTYIRSADATKRLNAPWLAQGVSTIIIGVDGYGTPDVKSDIDHLIAQKIGTNVAPFVGFGAVRGRVLGQADRAPSADELAREKELVAKGMCDGALGLSTGLFYAPQSFAKTDEVIALAHEAAIRGGMYDTHQRDESDYTIGLMNSIKEVLQIGREAGLPVHFAHLKALGVDLQGQAPEVVKLIDDARAKGQDVTADEYPWLASGSDLEASLVPRWAIDGGYGAMLKRLDDPATMAKIRVEMLENLRRRGGPASILLTSSGKPWTGKTLEAMAKEWKLEPVDAAVVIMQGGPSASPATSASGKGAGIAIASFNMIDSDVELIMKQPWVVTSSDGSDGHPRQYATFTQKYKVYVQEKHTITLENFIRHSTGLTADMYKLDHRGYLRPGYFADVAVLDPASYAPRADYLHPRELSVGVKELFVNGALAVENSTLTGAAAGRGLLRPTPVTSCPR